MCVLSDSHKMKKKKYHTVEANPKSKRKVVHRDKMDTTKTLSWLGTNTSIKSGGVKR